MFEISKLAKCPYRTFRKGEVDYLTGTGIVPHYICSADGSPCGATNLDPPHPLECFRFQTVEMQCPEAGCMSGLLEDRWSGELYCPECDLPVPRVSAAADAVIPSRVPSIPEPSGVLNSEPPPEYAHDSTLCPGDGLGGNNSKPGTYSDSRSGKVCQPGSASQTAAQDEGDVSEAMPSGCLLKQGKAV